MATSFGDMSGQAGTTASDWSLLFLNAAKDGDEDTLGALLDQVSEKSSVKVNVSGTGKMTALHLATEGNHQCVLRRLLRTQSIDVNAQDELGRTAVIIAAEKGFGIVVQMLQGAGSNMLLFAHGGYSALHVAASLGYTDVVNLIVGIRPSEECGYEDFDAMKVPGQSWSSPKSANSNGKFSRFRSRDCSSNSNTNWHEKSKHKLLRKLGGAEEHREISLGATASKSVNPQLKSEDGEMQDTFQPSTMDVLSLLEAKTDAELLTPLHLAAGNGHQQVVVSLLQSYGQAVGIAQVLAKVRHEGGQECLDVVITSIIRILNSRGESYSMEDVKSDILDRALETYLHQSHDITSLPWSSIDALVSYVNAKDCIGRTPLHHASSGPHVGVVQKLLDVFVVNVNAADMDGYTPLHLSSWKGDQGVVKLLVTHHSKFQMLTPNVGAKQNKATRAKIVDLKRRQQKLRTVSLTKDLQDSHFVEERDGMTALHYAVERNHEGIVAALAGLSDIDVFSVANCPRPKQSITDSSADEEKTPLSIAIRSDSRKVLQMLLKSGKRNRIMQELQMLRGYFSRSSKFDLNRKTVKDYHRLLSKTTVGMVKSESKILGTTLFDDLENELALALNTLLHKSPFNKFTLLHHAAFAGLSLDLEFLLSASDLAHDINTTDMDSETPLHFAVMEGATDAVTVLMKNKALRPNEEDRQNRTALHVATEKGWRDIVNILMDCPDVKLSVERLYRERGVNENAANAILVVAALIASVTFAGWLQPPMGLRMYYNVKPARTDPPGTIEAFAGVQQFESVLVFWVFNSLSFFFAMATVISGAAEVLPMRDAFIGQEVRIIRGGLVRTSFLLVLSIIFVLVAFAAAGFASLPPIDKYRHKMRFTTIVGGWACCSMLTIFGCRMSSMFFSHSGDLKITWWRWPAEDIASWLPFGKYVWKILMFFNLIPDNYARFDSRRQEHMNGGWKKRVVWKIIKLFKLDKDEYWRYQK